MEEKIPRFYAYVVVFLVVAIGALLVWRHNQGTETDSPGDGETAALEEKGRELEEKQRRIQALESQVARLSGELQKSSSKVAELQARLDETTKALFSSAQERLREEKSVTKPVEPSPTPSRRGPAEPGSYEVIRSTSVFSEPSDTSRKVSTINKGTRVRVLGGVGEWLEVRSKHGNPPGFIRRQDAMFVERQD